jgi:hypothetical protein
LVESFHFRRFIEDVAEELVLFREVRGTVDDEVGTSFDAPTHGELLVLLDLLGVVVKGRGHEVLVVVVQDLEDILHVLQLLVAVLLLWLLLLLLLMLVR